MAGIGIGAAVVAIIAVAGWRFARTALKDRFTIVVAILTPVGEYLLRHPPRFLSERSGR